MRQRDDIHGRAADLAFKSTPDYFGQLHPADEPLDRDLADWNQHFRFDHSQFLLKPWRAVGDLLTARLQVSSYAAPGKALHHGRDIAERPELVLLEPRLGQPLEQPPPCSARERPAQ
jgi:hypothetical protein